MSIPFSQTQQAPLGLPQLLDHLSGFSTCVVLSASFEIGLFDALQNPQSSVSLAETLSANHSVLLAILDFLVRQGYIARGTESQGKYNLTQAGKEIMEVRGWIELIVAGYGGVLLDMPRLIKGKDSPASRRNMAMVGRGSAAIGKFDSIPLTFDLIRQLDAPACHIVDLGCGNAQCLHEYAKWFPQATIRGCEPSREGYAEAQRNLLAIGADAEKVQIINCSAENYPLSTEVDVIVLAFVLHEIAGTLGEDGVVNFLKTVCATAPHATVIIVEVDSEISQSQYETEIGRGYYAVYHLLHVLTGQKLLPQRSWLSIFKKAGYEIVARAEVAAAIDPTGLELGFALRPKVTTYRNLLQGCNRLRR